VEKRTPHCNLPVVKAMCEAEKVRSTMSALAGGAALGFDFEGIIGVVMELTPADFHNNAR
jgi:motility quorum-sensing regulator/GCU-specific mRNA interferase toxin